METSFTQQINGVINTPFIQSTFTIMDNYRWMKLRVHISKKGWYSIFVWDPNNVLRVQSLYINSPKTIILSNKNEETSYSCVAGDIPIGEWKMEILTPSYIEEPNMEISIEYGEEMIEGVLTETAPIISWASTYSSEGFELDNYLPNKIHNNQKKWYKGDFHTHTTESDGKLSVKKGLEQARNMNLDFFVATDHNILPTKWENSEILVIPGIEITSSKGHFNALGLMKWIDWRPTCSDGGMETEIGMARVMKEANEAGAIISMNHPMLKPWEWQYDQTRLDSLDMIEIWNDPTYQGNPKATEEILEIWNDLWNDGHVIYGIGGSDSHLLPDESYEENGPPSVIGDPATYVLADNLSAKEILKAVNKGRVYVSRGPELDFTILADDVQVDPGSKLITKPSSKPLEVVYKVEYKLIDEKAVILWIENGVVIAKDFLNCKGNITREFKWEKAGWSWLRCEIRDNQGNLLAFVNPIYTGDKQTSYVYWGDIVKSSLT